MSLTLTEQHEPAESRNSLYIEQEAEGDGAFIVICSADEDPSQPDVGETIVLTREQVATLRKFLDTLTT